MLQTIFDFGTRALLGLQIPLRIYGYGLMLVLGFLSAILLAQWRARRAGENPEHVSRIGLFALIGGILGARIAYIIQHPSSFTSIGSMLDVTSGGLIYYGGVVLATLTVLAYLFIKRLPVRRYLDIVAPSLMIGLAFGRAGCTLNGCCYGATVHDGECPVTMRFPMFSKPLVKLDGRENPFSADTRGPTPPYQSQLSPDRKEADRVHPPEALINHRETVMKVGGEFRPVVELLQPKYLHGALKNDQTAVWADPNNQAQAKKAFLAAAGPDGLMDEREWEQARKDGTGLLRGSEHWDEASYLSVGSQVSFEEVWAYFASIRQRFDADKDGRLNAAERSAANAELQVDQFALAGSTHSLPTKPAQVLAMLNALLLALLLSLYYRHRRREGEVFALLAVLYPITRFVEESMRADNAHDLIRGILTHNQYTSLALASVGIVFWLVLGKLAASCGPLRNRPQFAEVIGDRTGNRPAAKK